MNLNDGLLCARIKKLTYEFSVSKCSICKKDKMCVPFEVFWENHFS